MIDRQKCSQCDLLDVCPVLGVPTVNMNTVYTLAVFCVTDVHIISHAIIAIAIFHCVLVLLVMFNFIFYTDIFHVLQVHQGTSVMCWKFSAVTVQFLWLVK